jgi:hypothetical protein
MPPNTLRRWSRGFISYSLLAILLAIASSAFALLDWREAQNQRRESQRLEQQREEHLHNIERDLAALKLQVAARPDRGPSNPLLIDRIEHARAEADGKAAEEK